jgi:hypothetical protein
MSSPYIFPPEYAHHHGVATVQVPGLAEPVRVTPVLAARLRELIAAGQDDAARTLVTWLGAAEPARGAD